MNIKDFANNFADAIQLHEGWAAGNPSVRNNNEGNLNFVGQPGAVDSGDSHHFAKFFGPVSGDTALKNDLTAKLNSGLDTIRAIIYKYAPPFENNTAAYITAVCTFFSWRNITIGPDDSIKKLLATNKAPVVVVALNNMLGPADWHVVQQAISQCAGYMRNFVFTTCYAGVDLNGHLLQQKNPDLGADAAPWYYVDTTEVQSILQQFNTGQELNMLLYNIQGLPKGVYYGGLTFEGLAVSYLHPSTSFGQCSYEPGTVGVDMLARTLFHELIHELFARTGDPDTLHAYLKSHGGYPQNLASDLLAVFQSVNARYMALENQIAALEDTKAKLETAVAAAPVAIVTHPSVTYPIIAPAAPKVVTHESALKWLGELTAWLQGLITHTANQK